MAGSDRSKMRDNPWDPLAGKGRWRVWNSRRGKPSWPAVKSRINRPDIWMHAIRSDPQKLLRHGGRPHMGPGSRPGHESYFLTQITRTTDAFASGDPPLTLTPFALRKSRTVFDVTSTACAPGAALAGPATSTGFNSATPANLPSPSSAAAPEKPSAGGGESATSLLPPSCATEALTLLTAAPPPWLCGSAMPVRSSAVFDAAWARSSGFNPRAP